MYGYGSGCTLNENKWNSKMAGFNIKIPLDWPCVKRKFQVSFTIILKITRKMLN